MKDILDRRCVLTRVAGNTKSDILAVMADALESAGYIEDRRKFDEDLDARERTYPTYIGYGIGLPHCLSHGVSDTGLCIAKLEIPVHWSEMRRDSDADFILMIAGKAGMDNANVEHLKLLARLSMLFMHADFREALMESSADEIYAKVTAVLGSGE